MRAAIFSVYLPGRGHFSLTDLSLASPFLVRLLECGQATRDPADYLRDINQTSLEFFNRYLQDQGE
ncbi:MAG: alpha/beta hydrolase, partial [Anaerolineales bacterium]